MKKRVIIESPYAGDIDENLAYLHECCRDCLRRGESPYASHGFFTQFLDDTKPDERELGIEAGLAWGNAADLIVVYVDKGISEGMKSAINGHIAYGRPIEYRSLPGYSCGRFEEIKPSSLERANGGENMEGLPAYHRVQGWNQCLQEIKERGYKIVRGVNDGSV